MSTTTSLVSKWLKVKKNRKRLYDIWWQTHTKRNDPYSDKLGEKYLGEMDAGKYLKEMRRIIATDTGECIFFFHLKDFKKYWEKYHQKIRPKKIKANGGKTPFVKKTTGVYTFLSRGFVHESDFKWENDKYYVKCNIAPLWFPLPHDHHQDALQTAKRVGVAGYTGCPLAGKKGY